jgi:uncharacterized membrane protein YgcG
VLLLAIGRLFRSCQSFLGQALLHLLPEYLVLQRVLLFPGSFDLDFLHLLLFLNVLFGDPKVLALGVARGGAAGGVRGGGGSSGSGLGNYESKVFGCYP